MLCLRSSDLRLDGYTRGEHSLFSELHPRRFQRINNRLNEGFTIKPGALISRQTAPGDYTVEVDVSGRQLVVGRIMRVARSPARSVWFWTVTGPVTPTALCGEAETLQDNGTLCGRRGPAQEGLAVRWRGSVAERVSG